MNAFEYKMSRRKQANPKSCKDDEDEVPISLVDIDNNLANRNERQSDNSCDSYSEISSEDEEEVDEEMMKNGQVDDDEIDVETFSNNGDEREEQQVNIDEVKSLLSDVINDESKNIAQSSPFMFNGKKYYPLIFKCSDCGLRYSDKNTLITHQKNYCSKRNQDLKKNENCNQEETTSTSSETNKLKTLIYQCNNCSFTTDKIFIMNKHSRVHLPQKRKAMEELNKDDSNQLQQVKFDPSVKAAEQQQQQQTYCKECDIKFSSLKTYFHHRTHYCQKYKTIEAILPVNQQQATIKLSQPSPPPLPAVAQLASPTSNIIKQVQPTAAQATTPSEIVFIPMCITKPQQQQQQQQQPTPNLFRPQLQILISARPPSLPEQIPLDLRLTNNVTNDTPLDLSIQKTNLSPKIDNDERDNEMLIYCKNCKNSFETVNAFKLHSCKLKLQQQQHLQSSMKIETYVVDVKHQQQQQQQQQQATTPTLPQKQCYICSACGYRGNTIRGVRQHGKLHLSNNESFSIIDSLGGDFVTNDHVNRTNQRRSSNKSDDISEIPDIKRFKSDNPFNANSINQSLYYCSACKIHFQQEFNYLAHKKFYCILKPFNN